MDTPDVDTMLRQAAARSQQEQRLLQLLQGTLQNPACVHRAGAPSLIALAREAGGTVLQIALVNGERWDIPLNPQQRRLLAEGLGQSAQERT